VPHQILKPGYGPAAMIKT